MYFWNVKALSRDLSAGRLTPNQKMKYLLAYGIIAAANLEILRLFGPRFSLINLTQSFGAIAFMAGGIIICYQANQKGDGRDFIERFICLGLPITIRVGVLSFIIYGLYWIAGSLIVGEHFSPNERGGPFDLAVALFINIIYFLWMRQNLLAISTAPMALAPTPEIGAKTNRSKFYHFLKWAMAFLLVFIMGMGTGGYLGFKEVFKPFKFLFPFLAIAAHEEITKYQYQNADYIHAKTALLNHIKFLDQARASGTFEDEFLGERSYYIDTGLTYGRLFLLEEKAGKTDEKEKALQEASNRFKMAGWKDYSEAKIRERLLKSDK